MYGIYANIWGILMVNVTIWHTWILWVSHSKPSVDYRRYLVIHRIGDLQDRGNKRVRVIFGSLGPQPQTQVPMVSVEMQLMGWWWADGYEMPGGWWKVSSAWCWNLEDFLCATAKGEKTQQMVFFCCKKSVGIARNTVSFMTWPFGYGSNTKFTPNKGAVVSTSQHDDHDVAGCEQQGTKVPRYWHIAKWA